MTITHISTMTFNCDACSATETFTMPRSQSEWVTVKYSWGVDDWRSHEVTLCPDCRRRFVASISRVAISEEVRV